MHVQRFEVGPILGYVETHRARVFGRARLEWRNEDEKALGPRRCFGAVRARSDDEHEYRPATIFKALPHFDLTGVGIVSGLDPDTPYSYQAGWFFSESEPDDLDAEELVWDGVPEHSFQTASADPAAQRSFIFGSCRYLLRLFGGYVFESRGDKTFLSILKQMEEGTRTDGFIMLGDQIYADDLNFVGPDSQVDEFLKRYRAAFSQPHLSRLMSSVPTYMTLDDHEIEDNWPHKADARDLQVKYPAAIHAYSIYQVAHSPLGQLNATGDRLASVPNRFWYDFSDGCCDVFMLDARTERQGQVEIIGPEQMLALKKWLAARRNQVKIIVSSVPLFPDFLEPSSDKWSGFLSQRDELLNFIHDKRVRKVVTLSGDVHCSMSVELVSEADPKFRIISVVSSPFYWPYPHPSRKTFQLEGRLLSQSPYGYTLTNASTPVTTENFTRLTVAPEGVEVAVFGRKGERKDTRSYPF